MLPSRTVSWIAAALLLAACTDTSRLVEPAASPPPGEAVVSVVRCTARVADASVRCDAPAPEAGPRLNVILGGQGTYVRLRSDSVRSDPAAGTFSMQVSVQNLLDEVMGTPDGTTVAGVRVFFASLPAATQGAGEVTVANADGEGTFTAAGQPYFRYDEILAPLSVSAPRTWAFTFAPGVEAFAFTVYVETSLPREQGVLRWVQERGTFEPDYPYGAVTDVWGASETSLFLAVGPSILHFDGTRWRTMPHPGTSALAVISGTSARNVYAAGDGEVLRYDGAQWRRVFGPDDSHHLVALAVDGERVAAVGWRQESGATSTAVILHSPDGGRTWTTTTGGTSRTLADVWVRGDTVLVAGSEAEGGVVRPLLLRSVDGGRTWPEVPLPAGAAGQVLQALWRDPSGETWLGGGGQGQSFILHSPDGGATWADTTLTGDNRPHVVRTFWRVPGGDLYAAGDGGTFLRLREGTWSDLSRPEWTSFSGLWGTRGDHLFAAAGGGEVLLYDGQHWTPHRPNRTGASETLVSISGYGADGVYAVGYLDEFPRYGGVILHATPAGWERWAPAGVSRFVSVWAGGPADVWVVADMGRGLVAGEREGLWRKASGGWTKVTLPVDPVEGTFQLDVVTGSGPNDVYVFGRQIRRYYGRERLIMFHTADRGRTWTALPLPAENMDRRIVAASAPAPGELYVTGATTNQDFILRYDGTSWVNPAADPSGPSPASSFVYYPSLHGIWSRDGEVFVAVGTGDQFSRTGGAVMHSRDRGATWRSFPPYGEELPNLYAVWGTSARDVYAAGRGGTIVRWDGERWTRLPVGGGPEWRAGWSASPRDLWVVGRGGSILHGTR